MSGATAALDGLLYNAEGDYDPKALAFKIDAGIVTDFDYLDGGNAIPVVLPNPTPAWIGGLWVDGGGAATGVSGTATGQLVQPWTEAAAEASADASYAQADALAAEGAPLAAIAAADQAGDVAADIGDDIAAKNNADLPTGYTWSADDTITGPGGGSLTLAGQAADGSLVFARLDSTGNQTGAYFVVDSDGDQMTVTKSVSNSITWLNPITPNQAQINYSDGIAFQTQALQAAGITQNTTAYTVDTPGYGLVTTIPDGLSSTGVTEFKGGAYVTSSAQLAAQMEYATDNQIPFTLLVSPNTTVSGPLYEAITANPGNGWSVRVFNPATGQTTPYPAPQ